MEDEDKCYRVWWDSETDVVHTDWLPGAVCGLADATAVHEEIVALGRGRVLSLADLRKVDSIDRPAREFFMQRDSEYCAVALLASSAPTRMLANFFIGLKRGPIPLRMFTNEQDAVEWLQAQR